MSALACYRQPRIMLRQISGDKPTPKEQILFLPILSGQRPDARFRGLVRLTFE